MKTVLTFLLLLTVTLSHAAEGTVKRDVLKTAAGDVEMLFIGHSSLIMTFQGKVIHFDPWGKMADYTKLPKADLVFLTHDHNDHFDLTALRTIQKKDTLVVLPPICSDRVPEGSIMENGESLTVKGIEVRAVPAYNLVHKRDDGKPYHPKGIGNGYILTFGDKRVYVAGDTENLPEIKALKGIDCAFLPMNVPPTMSPEMVADVAKAMRPKILYPYHYGTTDPTKLIALLKDTPGVEVRIRQLR
jgi:L-ascorbate metabolism protein UlaG (beta-lactamase superfamily)